MTSMLKRVDVAVFDFIKSFQDGAPLTGVQVFDLKKDGVGYSTSGGQVDDIATKLDELQGEDRLRRDHGPDRADQVTRRPGRCEPPGTVTI